MLANYPQDCANCLSSDALSAFLASNSVANQAVQNLIQTGFWPTGDSGPVGWTISDPTYGTVTLVEDGNGNLYALVPSGGSATQNQAVTTIATTTNAPPYVSPSSGPSTSVCPGWSNVQSVNDLLACLSSALSSGQNLIITGVSLYVLYKLLK